MNVDLSNSTNFEVVPLSRKIVGQGVTSPNVSLVSFTLTDNNNKKASSQYRYVETKEGYCFINTTSYNEYDYSSLGPDKLASGTYLPNGQTCGFNDDQLIFPLADFQKDIGFNLKNIKKIDFRIISGQSYNITLNDIINIDNMICSDGYTYCSSRCRDTQKFVMSSPENIEPFCPKRLDCSFYKYSIEDSWAYRPAESLTEDIFLQGDYSLGCFNDEFAKAKDYCNSLPILKHMKDDCIVANYFGGQKYVGRASDIAYFRMEKLTNPSCSYCDSEIERSLSRTKEYLGSVVPWFDKTIEKLEVLIKLSETDPEKALLEIDKLHYANKEFYLDSQCSLVETSVEDSCDIGTLLFVATPVSLIWEADDNIDKEATLASFPLNLNSNQKWYTWKASEKTPLLVYDPDRTGIITSASQLFGNWTFGGKQLASADSSFMPMFSREWKDGYEALATLDSNFDNKLSGDELSSLALWFDKNRDGKSQAGEVKSLADVGVVSLNVVPDRRDANTRNIYADVGYERVIDGKVIQGASVDWYAGGYENSYELIQSQLDFVAPYLANADRKDSIKKEFDKQKTEASNSKNDKAELNVKNSLNGVWYWQAEAKGLAPGNIPQGYFTFEDQGDGTISGHSATALNAVNAKANAAKRVSFVPFKGTKVLEKSITTINFAIEGTGEGNKVTSIAKLSKDGQMLMGKTDASTNINGQTVKFSYNWKAVRK